MTAHRPFTQPWADAIRDALESDAEAREAGRRWSWPVALVLDPRPDLGYPDAAAVLLAFREGRCERATALPAAAEEVAAAPFALRADWDAWKRVVRGDLDLVAGVLKGAVKVTGALPTLMANVGFARALVAAAGRVPMDLPDEAPAGGV